MPKLSLCDRCLLCAHDYHLVCAVHPDGPKGNTCLDFRPDPQLEGKHFVDFLDLGEQPPDDEAFSNPCDLDPQQEQWEPEGARFVGGELVLERVNEAHEQEDCSSYNGEEIIQAQQLWTREEMLELLDSHPLFTNRCPSCEMPFPRFEKPPIHWDCECGWKDDSI